MQDNRDIEVMISPKGKQCMMPQPTSSSDKQIKLNEYRWKPVEG
jgi:hypothetical protein